MEEKKDLKTIIQTIMTKYSSNNNIKVTGKVLNCLNNTKRLRFNYITYKSSDLNPFSSDIHFSFEFMSNSTPYITILNDFINPTLNDGRNIFYCLTKKHDYIFDDNNLDEFETMFDDITSGIKYFLLCLKENIQINVYIYYGEYEVGRLYQINDFLINKNTLKFFRIYQINGKSEQLKYIIITQLFFLLFEPDKEDMSFAKLEQSFLLKDINFAIDEVTLKNSKKTSYFLKIVTNSSKIKLDIEFSLYVDDPSKDLLDNKYEDFKNVLLTKKNEINFQKYKIIITNYKPLFTIDIKKNNKKEKGKYKDKSADYKLYIAYYEELINYYKDFKEEDIKERVKTYLTNLTYYCVDFITFYNSEPDEIKIYQDKMLKYLNEQGL